MAAKNNNDSSKVMATGKKKAEKIDYVLDSQTKRLTNDEIQEGMERYRVFQRSLFGENHEAGTVKIKRGQQDPRKITMLMVEREFLLAQMGRHNAESTLKTYQKHFNWVFDFLGFQYFRQSMEHIEDAISDNAPKYGTSREVGQSMPVLVLETDNFPAFYQDYLQNVRHLSEQTILSAMRHLRAIIYFAQQQKWIKEFDIKIKEVQPDIKPTFSQFEIDKLSKKPRKEDVVAYRNYVMIRYLAATGNRIGSLLALNVGDIDFEESSITVNTQKNKKPKLMPLTYDLRKILREYIYYYRTDPETGVPLFNEPLFCNSFGERLSYTGARDAMEDYFKERGVEWCGFHKFRHSYAANWIRDGGNPFMLKEQLGHTSLAMTNRYANIYGMATKDEAEQHSLSQKFKNNTGRKKLKINK